VPAGVTAKEGDEWVRATGRRKIVKYMVDAMETLDDTDWPGSLIPLFPVLGPEIYIDGKLNRLSLIAGALDAQRALNYVATTGTECPSLLSLASRGNSTIRAGRLPTRKYGRTLK
jgi:hypothetical protein